jgi:hypothetical protein
MPRLLLRVPPDRMAPDDRERGEIENFNCPIEGRCPSVFEIVRHFIERLERVLHTFNVFEEMVL